MAAILDTFDRPNEGPPPSSNWINVYNGLKVVSNQCKGNASNDGNVSFWNQTMGPDVEVDCVIAAKGGTNFYTDIFGRMTTTNISTTDGYSVRMDPKSGTDVVTINRIDNGAVIQLGASISQEFSAGDGFRLRIVGNVISAWRYSGGVWTELGNRIDSTYTAAGYVGLGQVHTTGVLDDFGAETISEDIIVTPAPVTAKGVSVDPTVVLGSLTITPAIAAARAAVVDPNVVLGSITITPTFATARAVTVGPIVIGGGGINPLGEGDSPGFLAFLVAKAMYNELTAAGLGAGLNEPDENNSSEWETFLFG